MAANDRIDVLSDPRSLGNQLNEVEVGGENVPLESTFQFKERQGFPEIVDVMAWDWDVESFGRFRFDECISVKEARVCVWDLEKTLRNLESHNLKHF